MVRQYLGVDFGERRVGVAVGGDDIRIASPLMTLVNDPSLAEELAKLASQYQPAAIVVGLPRNLEGEDTPQTAAVRAFAQSVQTLGYPVELQDEALTSAAVHERLKPTQAQIKDGLVDREAAAMILQDYLDQL